MTFTNYTYFINDNLIIVRLSHLCTVLEEKVLMTGATQAHQVVSTLLFLPGVYFYANHLHEEYSAVLIS